jgi:hypothetical protein
MIFYIMMTYHYHLFEINFLKVKNPKISESIIKSVESNSGFLGLFMRKDLNIDEIITDDKQLYKVGTFGQVKLVQDTNQGTQLFIMAHRRLIIDEIVTLGPPTIAKVTHWNRPNLVPSSKSYFFKKLLYFITYIMIV